MGRQKKDNKIKLSSLNVRADDKEMFVQWMMNSGQEYLSMAEAFHLLIIGATNGLRCCEPCSGYCKVALENHGKKIVDLDVVTD